MININFKLKNSRMIWIGVILIIGIILVVSQLANYQIVEFEKYQGDALKQQTRETSISAKRGAIYDRNMLLLASNAAVERVFIDPSGLDIAGKRGLKGAEAYEADEIIGGNPESSASEKIRREKAERLICEGLNKILGVEYEKIYEMTQKKKKRDITVMRGVEISVTNEIRKYAAENRIIGINYAQETKRVYPYSNLASHVIGFTGADNNGQLGIELKYDEYLKGVAGKIVTATDVHGKPMNTEYETYVEAQNGSNLVLTIDWTIQSFLEKHLETAFTEAQAAQRVSGIIMDVNSGEILAMSTKPDFDLNNPRTLDEEVMKYINLEFDDLYYEKTGEDGKKLKDAAGNSINGDKIEDEIDKKEQELNKIYTPQEREEQRESMINWMKLNKLWKNKAITEPYEPGSTFKVITAAIALEEKAVSPSDRFYCSGSHVVIEGTNPVKCHLTSGHGSVTFAEGLQASCNPTVMMTAERTTAPVWLKYFDAFGYNEKTGIDLPGEAASVTHSATNFGPMELATSSFGQTFKITAIQQIVGLAAVANGGKVVTPHLVKAIIDDSGNIIKNFEPEIKRTVLSQETATTLANIMAEGVANGGAARNAFVQGYNIAAKTGTSQKRGPHDDDAARIGSCAAFAPAENPQIVMIIIVDEPDLSVSSMYGGVIAAPYVSKTLADVLPYLSVEPNYTEEEKAELQVLVKDYRMQKVSAIKEEIESKGLSYVVAGNGEYVREQIPKNGSMLRKGGKIILYTDAGLAEKDLIEVPNLIDITAEEANNKLVNLGLNINIIGGSIKSSASSYRQEPAAGEKVAKGTIVTVEFRHMDRD